MNAGRIVIKAEMDNSDLKKGLAENEAMIEASASKNKLTEYKEYLDYWKKEKQKEEQLLKEKQKIETSTYIQTRKENIAEAQDAIEFYQNKINELKNGTQEIIENIAETSEKTNLISKGLDLAKKAGKGLFTAFSSVAKFAAKALISVIGISVLLGALVAGISILAMGFKQAFGNEQIKQDIANIVGYVKYVIFAIGKVLVPSANNLADVIAKIVSFIAKAFQYIAVIVKAWTGVDFYEETGVEQLNDGLKDTNASAKELRKTLAGFDEMNVLNKNGSVGALGGIGESALAGFDISSLENVQLPGWLEWIKNNGEFIKNILIAIEGAFIAMAAGASLFMGIGIGIALMGLVNTISAIINFIKDPSWSNFGEILKWLGIMIDGVAIAMIAFNATNPIGWITLAIGIITTMIGGLTQWYGKLDEGKIHTDNLKKSQEDLNNALKEFESIELKAAEAFDKAQQEEKNLQELEEKHRLSGWKLYQEVANGTKQYGNLTEAEKEVYKQYLRTMEAMDQLEKITEEEIESKEKVEKKNLEVELSNYKLEKSYDKYGEAVVKAYKDGTIEALEANRLIGDVLKDMDKDTKKTFLENIPESIKRGLDSNWFERILEPIKTAWKGLMKGLEASSTIKIKADTSSIQSKNAAGAIAYTKLASGGIINQPGKGVPLSSAIGGERGAEGVFPLTDSQQMELLGSTIGRYITVAPTIPVYVGNRMVAREIRKINAEDNFASNG